MAFGAGKTNPTPFRSKELGPPVPLDVHGRFVTFGLVLRVGPKIANGHKIAARVQERNVGPCPRYDAVLLMEITESSFACARCRTERSAGCLAADIERCR